MLDDFLKSVGVWLKERTTSPLYGTFIMAVVLVNWKIFYILFWQPEDKLLIPRIEYVQKYIIDTQNIYQHISYYLIIPALLTFFIIWFLSDLSNFVHRKHLKSYYSRLVIVDDAKLEYERQKKDRLEIFSDIRKQQFEVKKEIELNSTENDKWNDEFSAVFSNNEFYIKAILKASDAVYRNGGLYTTDNDAFAPHLTLIDPKELSALDVFGLILIQGHKIEFTKKGKYFLYLLQGKDIVTYK